MITNHVFEIHVYEVTTELDADGTTPTLIDCARYCTEAPSAQDAVMSWGEQLSAEEAS